MRLVGYRLDEYRWLTLLLSGVPARNLKIIEAYVNSSNSLRNALPFPTSRYNDVLAFLILVPPPAGFRRPRGEHTRGTAGRGQRGTRDDDVQRGSERGL